MDSSYPNSQNYPNFQSLLNPEDFPNSQNYPYSPNYPSSQDYPSSQNYPDSRDYPNYQSSPNLNQIPISEPVQAENVSRNLFRETHQKIEKIAWRVKEDAALMTAWVYCSEDKSVGKNQRVGTLWARVYEQYHIAQKENPEEIKERNLDSMKGRFKRLNENANKWIAAYKQAYRRKQSGMSQQDVEQEAHTIYAAGGSKFLDLHVFNEVMIKHPKWELNLNNESTRSHVEDEESGGSSKRSRTSEEGSYSIPVDPETLGSDSSTISRPTGRDMAKKKKGKAKVSKSVCPPEVFEEIRALRITRNSEVESMNKLAKEKLDFERDKMKHDLLMGLLEKNHLTPSEEVTKQNLWAYFKY